MADLSLHETLTGRLEQFARDQVLERADRTCELMLALLKREGGLTVVDGLGRVGGRGLATVRDLLDDVAQSSGLSLALYVGERVAVASSIGLGKVCVAIALSL